MSVSGNLTGITSIYNATLSVGRGATNAALHFDTDETMMFAANNETQLLFKDGVVEPNTDNNYDLGSSSKEFKDLYIDGTAYIDAINFNGTAISATASEINLIDGGTARGTTAVSEGDGFLHNDAGTMRMTNVSKLADLFAGTGLSASEGVLSVDTLNQDTSGNAATATALATARTISGVSFDGTANITLNNSNITNGAGYTTNTGTVDTSGTPADNDFAKFTDANTIEGRSIAETKTDLSLNNVENKSSATIRGEIVSSDIPNNAADTSGNAATATTAGTVTTAAQPNITSLGTLTTLTVDDITINGSTISDATDLTIDCGGDITLDADGNDVIFSHNGTSHFALSDSSGDVLLTSTQQDKDLIFKGYDSTSLITALTLDMSDAGKATFNNDVVAFSDEKLKENIETLDGSKVYEMRGVSFTRKDTKKEGSGVIAQELQKIAPELVNETDGTLGVSYGNITGYLIEAIKDLKTEIEELKQKIK